MLYAVRHHDHSRQDEVHRRQDESLDLAYDLDRNDVDPAVAKDDVDRKAMVVHTGNNDSDLGSMSDQNRCSQL